MEKRLFVGNLPFSMTDADLETTFSEYGTVASATVIRDRDTGRSRGFGFVEMDTEDEAKAAQQGTDGLEVEGRRLRVNEAQPRRPRQPRYDDRW